MLIYLSPSVGHEFLGSQTTSHSSLYHLDLHLCLKQRSMAYTSNSLSIGYNVLDFRIEFILFKSFISSFLPSQALVVKNLPANAGDNKRRSFDPRSGRSPGEGHSNLLQYSCLENLHEQRSLTGSECP